MLVASVVTVMVLVSVICQVALTTMVFCLGYAFQWGRTRGWGIVHLGTGGTVPTATHRRGPPGEGGNGCQLGHTEDVPPDIGMEETLPRG